MECGTNNERKENKKPFQKFPCDEVDVVRLLPSLNVLEMAKASVRAETLSIPSSMSKSVAGGAGKVGSISTFFSSIIVGSGAGGASNETNTTQEEIEIKTENSFIN